jgi:hypothetical protein
MSTPPAHACDACGTLSELASLRTFGARRLCEACHAVEVKAVKLWGPALLMGLGTVAPPAVWILASVNWWRLGMIARVLIPAAALLLRAASVVLVGLVAPRGLPAPAAVSVFFGLNLACSILSIAGQPGHVRAHRAAGGQSASWAVAVGLAVLTVAVAAGYRFSAH